MQIKLLLVDDHQMVRKGLQVLLSTRSDIKIVGEASDGHEALEKTATLKPDVILMDLNMPNLNGIDATKKIKQVFPEIKIIVLTSFSDQDHVLPALRAGAKGYVLKDIEPEDLVQTIHRVHQGQVDLHPEIMEQLINLVSASKEDGYQTNLNSHTPEQTSPTLSPLTKREKEVLQLIVAGKNNKEIGEILFITEKTVKTHVSHLLDKLGVNDRTQAAIFALKHNICN
jgi:DNA-binding NarL/FixJ family response regulator